MCIDISAMKFYLKLSWLLGLHWVSAMIALLPLALRHLGICFRTLACCFTEMRLLSRHCWPIGEMPTWRTRDLVSASSL